MICRNHRAVWLAVFTVIASEGSSFEPAARAGTELAPVRCQPVRLRVALAPGEPADQTMAAELCARGSIQHKTIQILIHGATYDHNYWNWPYQPERYSYVRSMTAAGYAVLNLDRVGHGESSRPPDGTALDLHVAAFTIHQVVQELRSGRLVVPGFGRVKGERIQLVGFSLGSFISTIEASTYDDVDGIILSAYSHTVGPVGDASFGLVYPASFDPKFADLGLPPDYLTTIPGSRTFLFFYEPGVDPANLALDEQLKQTVTVGELADIFPSFAASSGVHVPTLVVVGDYDFISCEEPSCTESDSLADEASFYPADACVEVEVIPDAGHSLALHLNAGEFFAIAREWSDRWIGPSTKDPLPATCP
jgi:pimeloyl-ACP methyl ester carboxylesterase